MILLFTLPFLLSCIAIQTQATKPSDYARPSLLSIRTPTEAGHSSGDFRSRLLVSENGAQLSKSIGSSAAVGVSTRLVDGVIGKDPDIRLSLEGEHPVGIHKLGGSVTWDVYHPDRRSFVGRTIFNDAIELAAEGDFKARLRRLGWRCRIASKNRDTTVEDVYDMDSGVLTTQIETSCNKGMSGKLEGDFDVHKPEFLQGKIGLGISRNQGADVISPSLCYDMRRPFRNALSGTLTWTHKTPSKNLIRAVLDSQKKMLSISMAEPSLTGTWNAQLALQPGQYPKILFTREFTS